MFRYTSKTHAKETFLLTIIVINYESIYTHAYAQEKHKPNYCKTHARIQALILSFRLYKFLNKKTVTLLSLYKVFSPLPTYSTLFPSLSFFRPSSSPVSHLNGFFFSPLLFSSPHIFVILPFCSPSFPPVLQSRLDSRKHF